MKLRNKLILSCAALAAVATTAVSTTFAWYTANTEVKATPVNTASAASGSDMLMIADGITASTSGATTTYSAITDLTKLDWKQSVAPTVTNNQLMPLAYNSNAKALVNDTKGDPTAALGSGVSETSWSSATATYATFVLYFKNGSTTANQKLYVNGFTVKNVTGLTADQIKGGTATTKAKFTEKPVMDLAKNYTHFGWDKTTDAGTGAETISGHTNGTYKEDALRVLQLDVESHQIKAGATVAGTTNEVCYDLETLANKQSARIDDDLPASGFNAHTYYNAVMDTDLTITEDKTVKTDLTDSTGAAEDYSNALYLGQLPSAATSETINDCLRVEFKVFLNGWDLACFDACQGQNFQFEFSFTTDAPTSTSASKYIYTVVSA